MDKMAIKAEYMYLRGEIAYCQKYCTAVLRRDPDRFQVLNLLGRVYLRMNEFEKALKCLEKAQKLAPQNIERILNIADIHFEMGQVEQSQQVLQQAIDIDPDSAAVKERQAQHAIEQGHLEQAGAIMNDLPVIDNVIRDMNNRAVAYAKNGRYADSIRLYQDTIRVIPKHEEDIKKAVTYNLCLSYVKYGELENALNVVQDLEAGSELLIDRKIRALRGKIEKALAEGVNLKVDLSSHARLNGEDCGTDNMVEVAAEATDDELMAGESLIARGANAPLIEATRGDICCHLIYFDIQGVSSEADRLRKTLPHFRPRQSLRKTA
jgi:tetratricopeptide (TPR) repeat protein